ncbi:hypothetical protein ACFL6U_14740 [Planctomycetota bacterium]
MNNQRQVTTALNLFASDHDDRYPQSVAKVGFGDQWNWTTPTALVARDLSALRQPRAVGTYLGDYLSDVSTITCPGAPSQHEQIQQAWELGDDWDNPDTPLSKDALDGNYNLLWSYVGLLNDKKLFRGPQRPSGSRHSSDLLLTDYFGFNHYRTPRAYLSCERFDGANVLPESDKHSSCWTTAPDPNKPFPDVRLNAAYIDGHVETYSSNEAVPMRVIKDRSGNIPYSDDEPTPGSFYLP